MRHVYNCHAHIFNLDCAPLRFLDAYPGGAILRQGLNWLSAIPGAIPALVRLLRRGRWPLLQRYAAFLDIGTGISQVSVFEQKLLPNYPPGTRFVVLALNMDHMGAGAATLNYESQLWQLLEVRKRHPNTCLPFLCIDPRMGSATENLAFVQKWLARGFVGLKLYPSLGFFPFDERLDLVYALAEEQQLPVLTHCSRGGIYVQGPLAPALRQPPLPAALRPQLTPAMLADLFTTYPLAAETTFVANASNDSFSDQLLDPRLYDLVLARFPTLKLCLAHYGGGDELFAAVTHPAAPTAAPPTNWYAAVQWLMAKYPNVYTDVSFTLAEGPSVFRKQAPRLFEQLAADLLAGSPYRHRILFGTDFFLVTRLQPETTLAGALMHYLLALPPTAVQLAAAASPAAAQAAAAQAGAEAWQRLATDNPAAFLHSACYTPVERLGQPPSLTPYVPPAAPPPGLVPLVAGHG
jgi:predicted TIM-barrel fold metal-dependent hydrolase